MTAMLLVVGDECQPIPVCGATDDEVRIKDLFFLVIHHGLTVKGDDRATSLLHYGLRGRGIPSGGWTEPRINIGTTFRHYAEFQ